jgi:hypothetical protein
MKRYSAVHQYETCVSTGPQHLNPDPEILTVGEEAQRQHPYVLPAEAVLLFAFGLGFAPREDLARISS